MIIIITPILMGITYLATYEIAKISYHNSIQEKIDKIYSDQFFYAISASYPFLRQTADAAVARANSIKEVARDVGFDRFYFSVYYRTYINST